MGIHASYLNKRDLERYEINSFFTKAEINKVYKKFMLLTTTKLGQNPLTKKLSAEEFKSIPELQLNPFKDRIAKIFADENGMVGFDEFLDFFSVFSEEATREVKAYYAFKIYDFNDDGHITEDDIKKMLTLIVGEHLSITEIDLITKKVMEEADLDGEGKLSFVEFEHVVSRAHDLEKYNLISMNCLINCSTFRIRL